MASFASYSLSGSKWPSATITYSFATSTTPSSPGGSFSSTIPTHSRQGTGDPEFGAYSAIDNALAAWAQASGLTLQRVADSTASGSLPDIRIGYGMLSGGLSAFSASSINGVFQPGAEIMLEDRAADTIQSDPSGYITYATGQAVGAVAESAIGHALGLAGATGPSIRFGGPADAVPARVGDTSPALINAASIAGLESLYGPRLPNIISASDYARGSFRYNVSLVSGQGPVSVGGVVAPSSTSTLISLTSDGTVQLQANEPGAPVVTIPDARVIGLQSIRTFFPFGFSDPTGNAESVARLYQAEFGRSPDLGGLYLRADQVDQGAQSLIDVSNVLANSPEFIQAHPAASGTSALADTVFVDTIYRNLFGRLTDPAGAGYVTALLNGTSRGEIANDIAQSLEARLDWLPYEGDRSLGMIYRSYEAAFGRTPDNGGMAYFLPTLDAGLSTRDFAAALIASPEFSATSGAGSVPSFVAQIYQNALGRGPDAEGLAFYAGQIAGGASRAQVFADIANSSEARAYSALATHDGWVLLSSG